MAAANTDKFKKLTNNFSTTLSGAIVGASDTSMSFASTTNLPTDTGTVFVIDRVNSSGTATPTVREYVVGTVSGSNVTNLVRGVGNSTAQAHTTGAVVEQVVDQRTINDIVDGILNQHNQDGTHAAITATSVSAATLAGTTSVSDAGTTLQTMRSEIVFDHVASGCVITATSPGASLAWSMTSGVVYIGGKRLTVASASGTVTASKDTYFDLLDPGTGTVATLVNTSGNIVTNNAASPALAASSVRNGIIVSGATIATTASVNQGQEDRVLPIASSTPYAVTDSLGNLIYPRDPNRRTLGHKQILSAFTTASQTAGTAVTGVSCPVITTGRKIKISLSADYMTQNGGAATATFLGIYEGATELKRQTVSSPGTNYATPANTWVELTPTAGLHTYLAAFWVGANTGTLNATSTAPAELMVEHA